jgi:uncharacterized membrane protein
VTNSEVRFLLLFTDNKTYKRAGQKRPNVHQYAKSLSAVAIPILCVYFLNLLSSTGMIPVQLGYMQGGSGQIIQFLLLLSVAVILATVIMLEHARESTERPMT